RVGYRLALDHPGRLEQLAVLDIVTTWDMWHRMDARLAARAWHWLFLALAEPFPEKLIASDPKFFFDYRAATGAKAQSVDFFDARARITTRLPRIRPASTPCAKITAPGAPAICNTMRPIVPPAKKSAAPCSHCGAPKACRPMPSSIRSPAGATGRRTCADRRSQAAI